MINTITLSSKNQITIPKFILDLFGIKSGEKLLLETEANAIKITPVGKSIVDKIAASVKVEKSKQGIPFEKVLDATKNLVVQELAKP